MDFEKMAKLTQKMKNVNEGKNNDSSISPEEADNLNRQAVSEESDGYYQRAFELYLKAAKAGNVWAMRNLGFVYQNIKNDDRSAFEWFKKAAEHADVNLEAATDAMFEVGIYYYRGEVTPKDVVKSFSWCKKAAENGVVNAMNWVGNFYRNGEGVPRNCDEAVKWFKKSANDGNEYAMLNLGIMYERGEGINRNEYEAFAWYKRAAEAGNDSAMNNLALMYADGEGVNQNIDEALNWLNRAINAGNSQAQANLAYWYLKGIHISKNESKGRSLLEKAMKSGNTWAMEKYGDYWFKEVYEVQNAAICYKMAAEHGSADSAYKLSKLVHMYKMTDRVGLVGQETDYTYWVNEAKRLGCNTDKVDQDWEKLSSPSSPCFITTAVCDNFGKSDDCYELTTFRNFRDKWLINQYDGKSLIDKYYDIAPKIVSKINQLQNSNEIYKSIWSEYLKPCLIFIEAGKYQDCKNLYIKMVNFLQKSFLK